MKWLRRLVSPPNSLVIVLDHVDAGEARAFPGLLDEVTRFYEAVPLSAIVERLAVGKKPSGLAAFVLANARKSGMRHAVPELVGRKLPFHVFLRDDCIGLNRLPLEEEIDAFSSAYPQRFPAPEREALRAEAWRDPDRASARLLELRKVLGPLPVESIEPTRFFDTWGAIAKIPPSLLEVGLALAREPDEAGLPAVERSLRYCEQKASRRIRIAFSARPVSDARRRLSPLGLEGLQTLDEGVVGSGTDPWAIPRWTPR